MITVANDMSAFFDVDETLVCWYPPGTDPQTMAEDAIEIVNPNNKDARCWARPHRPHINKLIQHAARGQLVVVWSAGGSAWAEAAVKKLGLDRYVDFVMAKPQWAWDDLPMNEAIHSRCYLPLDKK